MSTCVATRIVELWHNGVQKNKKKCSFYRSNVLYRGEKKPVYRIVGFEVDPRSVASESLKMTDDSAGNEKKAGDKCVFPKESKVCTLDAESMCVCCIVICYHALAFTHILLSTYTAIRMYN